MTPDSRLRLALVSGSPMVRAGLRAGLEPRGEFEVVLDAGSFAASRDAGHAGAAVLIVDAPGPAEITPDVDSPPLVLLLPEHGAAPADWLLQGCSVLPRHAPIGLIAAAVQAAAAGLVASTRPLLTSAWRLGTPAAGGFEAIDPLTPREREVLQQMSLGLGNREIASALNISSHTAKFHVAQVIAKLDASSRTQAVANGLRAGLVEL